MPPMISPALLAYMQQQQGGPHALSPGDSPSAHNIRPEDLEFERRMQSGAATPPPSFSETVDVNAAAPPQAAPGLASLPTSMGPQQNLSLDAPTTMTGPPNGSTGGTKKGGFPWQLLLGA